jgi:hypothetical protein
MTLEKQVNNLNEIAVFYKNITFPFKKPLKNGEKVTLVFRPLLLTFFHKKV